MSAGAPNTDLLQIDDELTDEERLIRDTVRAFARDRVLPHVEDWFEEGTLPRDIMPELGKLGVLGMHLTGYGCAGAGAIAYGVACRELEACDSGLRSAASVQGSLSMFPIWRYGSEEQKTEWLPRMEEFLRQRTTPETRIVSARALTGGAAGATSANHPTTPFPADTQRTTGAPRGGWKVDNDKFFGDNGIVTKIESSS